MYYEGEGVPKDFVTSYMWLNLAAAQGADLGTDLRDIVEPTMTREQIAEAQRLSTAWKPIKPK